MPTTTNQVLSPTAMPQGSWTSGTFTIPPGIISIQLILNLQLADKLDTGTTVDFKVQVSPDNGTNWQEAAGGIWTSYGPGGFSYRDKTGTTITNPDPSFTFGVPPTWSGWQGRCVMVLSKALTVGATVVVTN